MQQSTNVHQLFLSLSLTISVYVNVCMWVFSICINVCMCVFAKWKWKWKSSPGFVTKANKRAERASSYLFVNCSLLSIVVRVAVAAVCLWALSNHPNQPLYPL